ncbi:MAG: hypothetical protein K6E79_05720 [Pseudobutyrivibrio sp.]|nr:hypothetical protein [Pseudobutyrivibrio sp.]
MKKRGLDRELIISLGVIALLLAIGIVFMVLFLFDIDITKNLSSVIGSYSGLSGSIWLFLLCRNC